MEADDEFSCNSCTTSKAQLQLSRSDLELHETGKALEVGDRLLHLLRGGANLFKLEYLQEGIARRRLEEDEVTATLSSA